MASELLRTLNLDSKQLDGQGAATAEELTMAASLTKLSDDDMIDALARELSSEVN